MAEEWTNQDALRERDAARAEVEWLRTSIAPLVFVDPSEPDLIGAVKSWINQKTRALDHAQHQLRRQLAETELATALSAIEINRLCERESDERADQADDDLRACAAALRPFLSPTPDADAFCAAVNAARAALARPGVRALMERR